MKIAKELSIQSYKHNGMLHRAWRKTVILEESQDILITGHLQTQVLEGDGRIWMTKEPAVCYFFKEQWFNVIAMMKKDGIFYYCNLSSPFVVDDEGIKYIDYDLDIKVYPNGSYQILDQNEYQYHSEKMHYSKDIKSIVEEQLKELIYKIETKLFPFDHTYVKAHYEILKKSRKGSK